ncbi:MAG: type II toxin-antitoxin system HicB family antitoxin [Candidatus Omnitrophica bacterium]|nr:type II toxin-antitoxin system HicB family antitoxin [Candidatus Omnitrophota bacterium]
MIYRVYIEKGEDFGFVAHCPAIPGCHTQGQTLEDAIENIKAAIEGCVQSLDPSLVGPPVKQILSVDVEVAA